MKLNDIINILVETSKKRLLKEDWLKIIPSKKSSELMTKFGNDDLVKLGYLAIKRNLQDRQQQARAFSVFVQAYNFGSSPGSANFDSKFVNSREEVLKLVQLIISQANNDFNIFFDDEMGRFRKADEETQNVGRDWQIIVNKYKKFLQLGSGLSDNLRQRFIDAVSQEAHREANSRNEELPCDSIDECQYLNQIFLFLRRIPDIKIQRIYNQVIQQGQQPQG